MFAPSLVLPKQLLEAKKPKRAARKKGAGTRSGAKRARAKRARAASR